VAQAPPNALPPPLRSRAGSWNPAAALRIVRRNSSLMRRRDLSASEKFSPTGRGTARDTSSPTAASLHSAAIRPEVDAHDAPISASR
jgi:hypothetical protein